MSMEPEEVLSCCVTVQPGAGLFGSDTLGGTAASLAVWQHAPQPRVSQAELQTIVRYFRKVQQANGITTKWYGG